MDLIIIPILFAVPFLVASLVRRAAKDIFPVLECCLLGAILVAAWYLWLMAG